MSDYDSWKTTPPEPDIVGECAYCGGELYANCEYIHDRNENEWFCDTSCFITKMCDAADLVAEVINRDS